MTLTWAMISVGALNLIGLGIAWGSLRNQVKNIPAIINGTVVRAHERRCINYKSHPDNTNPGI